MFITKLTLELNTIPLSNGNVEYYKISLYGKVFKIFKKNIFILEFYTRDEAQNVFNILSDILEKGSITYEKIEKITHSNNGCIKYLLF